MSIYIHIPYTSTYPIASKSIIDSVRPVFWYAKDPSEGNDTERSTVLQVGQGENHAGFLEWLFFGSRKKVGRWHIIIPQLAGKMPLIYHL